MVNLSKYTKNKIINLTQPVLETTMQYLYDEACKLGDPKFSHILKNTTQVGFWSNWLGTNGAYQTCEKQFGFFPPERIQNALENNEYIFKEKSNVGYSVMGYLYMKIICANDGVAVDWKHKYIEAAWPLPWSATQNGTLVNNEIITSCTPAFTTENYQGHTNLKILICIKYEFPRTLIHQWETF